jgi:uncharacterized protein YndB with AHSA1/START domain
MSDLRVSRIIKASRHSLYQAFVDPQALVQWLPPRGMKGQVQTFDARPGGSYRMTLTYVGSDHAAPGKTSDDTDVVHGRFLELIPDKRIVQQVEFDSEDPAFAGVMTMTWSFAVAPGGAEVTVLCENAPPGIRAEDHEAGVRSTLENLAKFTE